MPPESRQPDLIRRPRIVPICSSRLPDLRGCSNWPSPDAPGLFSFGAQFDPALADPLHDGSPMVGVSGVGLSLREAFQGCIGEGIEYLSQLQTGTTCCSNPASTTGPAKLGPKALEIRRRLVGTPHATRASALMVSRNAADRRRRGAGCRPTSACGVRRRSATSRRRSRLSIGSAAGPSWDAAALHGLLELIERDAASLWWRGGQPWHDRFRRSRGRHRGRKACCAQLRQGARCRAGAGCSISRRISACPASRRSPAGPDGSGFAFGLAARPTLEAAARSAILEMCQSELADAVVEAKRSERGEAALNAQDRIHLRRATRSNADRCRCCSRSPEHAHASRASTRLKRASYLRLIVERLEKLGIEIFGLDLTRQHFAVPVVARDCARPAARAVRDRHGEACRIRLREPAAAQPIPVASL